MPGTIACTLCGAAAELSCRFREKDYYRCSCCKSILMDPAMKLSPLEEKKRYDQHNNDVKDPGYRKFVQPLVQKILQQYGCRSKGLDYGAGSGPVAAAMLQEKGYNITLYDPYYWNDRNVLNKEEFDYIICCEVIEHFHSPAEEFWQLRSLLKPGGSLFCKTEIYSESLDFEGWYYKNDPTHVFFYHRMALEWIKSEFSFSALIIEERIIQLRV
jgi:SAM-dependent methyltransferase